MTERADRPEPTEEERETADILVERIESSIRQRGLSDTIHARRRNCADVAKALASARTEARKAALEWRSIETAPKDQFILLWCEEDKSRWLAKWQGDEWYGVDDLGLTRSGHSAGGDAVTGWFATHWMPLPPPPSKDDPT